VELSLTAATETGTLLGKAIGALGATQRRKGGDATTVILEVSGWRWWVPEATAMMSGGFKSGGGVLLVCFRSN
jgi:hypothetical protein